MNAVLSEANLTCVQQAKLALMQAIDRHLSERYNRQEDAARAIGIDQTRYSKLHRGNLQCFSIDWLFERAEYLDLRVTLSIE